MSTESISNWWNQPTGSRPRSNGSGTVMPGSNGSGTVIPGSNGSGTVGTRLVSSSGPSYGSVGSSVNSPTTGVSELSLPSVAEQPKPVWVSEPRAVVGSSGTKSNETLMRIISVVILICLVFLIGYVIYHWFWAKRTQKIAEDTAENAKIHANALQTGRAQAQAEANACPKKSQYGDTLPIGTDSCPDSNPSCPAWAANDECWIDPGYMLYNCKKSCKTCGLDDTTIDKIRDSNLRKCQDWGDCSNAQCTNWYHALRCRKTCSSHGCS